FKMLTLIGLLLLLVACIVSVSAPLISRRLEAIKQRYEDQIKELEEHNNSVIQKINSLKRVVSYVAVINGEERILTRDEVSSLDTSLLHNERGPALITPFETKKYYYVHGKL